MDKAAIENESVHGHGDYNDNDRQFNRHIMDELFKGNRDASSISLENAMEAGKLSQRIEISDLPHFANTIDKESAPERKVQSFIYSEAAGRKIDENAFVFGVKANENRMLAKLGAAQLADPQEASMQKDKHLDNWNQELRQSAADVASVGSTFSLMKVAQYLSKGMNPLLQLGVAAASIAAGGALNNIVAGRESSDFTGYFRNTAAYMLLNRGRVSFENTGHNFAKGFALGSAYGSLDYLTGQKNFEGVSSINDIVDKGLGAGFGAAAMGLSEASTVALLMSGTTLSAVALNDAATAYQKQSYLKQAWQTSSEQLQHLRSESIAPDSKEKELIDLSSAPNVEIPAELRSDLTHNSYMNQIGRKSLQQIWEDRQRKMY